MNMGSHCEISKYLEEGTLRQSNASLIFLLSSKQTSAGEWLFLACEPLSSSNCILKLKAMIWLEAWTVLQEKQKGFPSLGSRRELLASTTVQKLNISWLLVS
jgi:hypothetical protein